MPTAGPRRNPLEDRIPRAELERLYHHEGWSPEAIAAEFGVLTRGIRQLLQTYGLARRSDGKGKPHPAPTPRPRPAPQHGEWRQKRLASTAAAFQRFRDARAARQRCAAVGHDGALCPLRPRPGSPFCVHHQASDARQAPPAGDPTAPGGGGPRGEDRA